jgi:hypothetical protein
MPGSFIGKAAFSGGYQARYKHLDGDTIVQVGNDGDLQAEFEIRLEGRHDLVGSDLSLF